MIPKEFTFLAAYSSLFWSEKPYYIISGGRAGGKSTNIAAYFLLKLFGEDYFRGIVARYTQKSIKNSIYQDLQDLIQTWGLAPFVDISGDTILNKINGNEIITHSFKLSDGTQSAKGKGIANPTHLLVDEATEVDSEEEYIKLVDSFRKKGSERKIILAFNPGSKAHWIYKRFYLPDGQPNPKWASTHNWIHTTYRDNRENLDPLKVKEWEDSQWTDPQYFSHHILGEWSDIGDGQIFTDWQFNWDPEPSAEVTYGLDFGFSNDPTVLVETHKKGKRLWIKELLYRTGLTADDIVHHLQSLGVPKGAWIMADGARPEIIETIKRAGYLNCRRANKGAVVEGLDKIRRYSVSVHPASDNIIKEYGLYSWRVGTDKPIDKWNHAMDAIRYSQSIDKAGPTRLVVQPFRRAASGQGTKQEFGESEWM